MDLDGVILSAVSQTMIDTMWSHFYVEPKIKQTPTPEKKAKKQQQEQQQEQHKLTQKKRSDLWLSEMEGWGWVREFVGSWPKCTNFQLSDE